MKKGVIIVVIVLVLLLIVIGYLFLKSRKSSQSAEKMSQIINQGVLPSLGENTNPMKNKPDVNPVDASNPFRSIKTNPFE